MKQSGHLNPCEETGTGCTVTSKYRRTPPNKHRGVGRQQHNMFVVVWCFTMCQPQKHPNILII